MRASCMWLPVWRCIVSKNPLLHVVLTASVHRDPVRCDGGWKFDFATAAVYAYLLENKRRSQRESRFSRPACESVPDLNSASYIT